MHYANIINANDKLKPIINELRIKLTLGVTNRIKERPEYDVPPTYGEQNKPNKLPQPLRLWFASDVLVRSPPIDWGHFDFVARDRVLDMDMAVFSFLYLKKIKFQNYMSVLENFKNIPRSPYEGATGLKCNFFFFKFATKPLEKKKKRGACRPPNGRQAPVARWGGDRVPWCKLEPLLP